MGRARSDGSEAVRWRLAPSMVVVGAAEEVRTVGSGLWKPVEPQPSELETQIGGVGGLGCWLVGEDAGLDAIALEMKRGPGRGGNRETGRKEEEEGDGEQKRGGFGGWWLRCVGVGACVLRSVGGGVVVFV